MIRIMIQLIAMLGKPGSGKGTQAGKLAEKLGYKLYSTGNRFREIAAGDTVVGSQVRNTIDNGRLMPHWFASYLFEEALFTFKEEDKGIVFEGTGRTEPEAQLFHEIAEWMGLNYVVCNLEVSDEEVTKRILVRQKTQNRADDTEEVIKTRLGEYRRLNVPAIDYFKTTGNLIEIDGEQSPQKVHAEIMRMVIGK
jgi:adenylate kinase